ncbi:hypothetical protein ATANTOWER_017401, partial [Ataeniobius toweri]|nr:hypothetical protein [Ataeniobius toweri]
TQSLLKNYACTQSELAGSVATFCDCMRGKSQAEEERQAIIFPCERQSGLTATKEEGRGERDLALSPS